MTHAGSRWFVRRRPGLGPAAPPLLIAHRGASARAPENSLDAFAAARTDGADGVELDVLCARTGEVLVFHDDDLVRLAGRPERVGDLTGAEARAVRLLSGATIPSLREAFEACGPDLLVNVELKSEGLADPRVPSLVAAVAADVRACGVVARVLVSSFNPLALLHWQRCLPEVPTGLLFEACAPLPLRRAWAARVLRPAALHPEDRLCTPARVAAWRRGGRACHVWTVDAPGRLRELAAMGVDGLITNDPAAARRALQERVQ